MKRLFYINKIKVGSIFVDKIEEKNREVDFKPASGVRRCEFMVCDA